MNLLACLPIHSTVLELAIYTQGYVRLYIVYSLLNIEQFIFNVVTAAHKCPFRHQSILDVIYCNSAILLKGEPFKNMSRSHIPPHNNKNRKLNFA